MIKHAPLTLDWLLERCDLEEETGCLAWRGNCCNGKDPRAKVARLKINVRRELWQLAHPGVRLSSKMMIQVTCDEPRCVNPDHLVARTRSSVFRGRVRQRSAVLKTMLTKRAKSKLPQEKVPEIIGSGRSCTEEAAIHGVSPSMVTAIRRGEIRRDVVTPFAGLGAR